MLSSFPLSGAHSAAYENGNDDNNDAGYSSEDQVWADISEAKSYRVAQPRQLSTFRPSKTNVLSDVPERLVLKLRADETVTFIGEYNLHVISGIIVVYGAAIRAGDKPHLVFAPSTHALPALTAKGGAAEIAIVSTGLSMVGMNKLSPLWGRIWNARDAKDGDHSDDSGNRRSFMLVSLRIINVNHSSLPLIKTSFAHLATTHSNELYRQWRWIKTSKAHCSES